MQFSALCALGLAATARAAGYTDSFGYETLCAYPDLILNGLAYPSGSQLVLTDDAAEEGSSVFYNEAVDVTGGVVIALDVYTSDEADANVAPAGFAVVLQAGSKYVVGSAGAGLGYAGLEQGLALEVDFVQDASTDDPNDHHAAFAVSAGALSADTVDGQYLELPDEMEWSNSAMFGVRLTLPALDAGADSTNVDVVVTSEDYDGGTHVATWTWSADTATLLSLGLDETYVGVTAATSDDYALQALGTWFVSFTEAEGCADNFVADPAAPAVCEVDAAYAQCSALPTCYTCTTNAFCCGWTGSSCVAADDVGEDDDDVGLAGSCSAEEFDDDDGGGGTGGSGSDSGTDGAVVFLYVFVALLSVSIIVSSAYWVHRKKTVDESVAMLGDAGAAYSTL